MSEVLLQTIIERLEAFEIALLKENNTSKDEAIGQVLLKEINFIQSEIIKLPALLMAGNEKMNELLRSITALNFKLEKPIEEQIKHSHYFHKEIWISVGLFIFSLLFLYGWNKCNSTKQQFEGADIKYRYLKVNSNTVLLKLLRHTDSLYNINPDVFTKQVVLKEKYFFEQAGLLHPADEKEREARGKKGLKNRTLKKR